MAVNLDIRLLTVSEYHQMGNNLILKPDERVELLNGKIVKMSPIVSLHAYVVDRLNYLLVKQIDQQAVTRIQNPVTLGQHSEPEPDIVIAKSPHTQYISRHPSPSDILLLIEVADSSLPVDREVKLPLYASYDIPEVWIIDLNSQTLEVYRHPEQCTYIESQILYPGKREVAVLAHPRISIPTQEIFPKDSEYLTDL